jgi:hypothetical protein
MHIKTDKWVDAGAPLTVSRVLACGTIVIFNAPDRLEDISFLCSRIPPSEAGVMSYIVR